MDALQLGDVVQILVSVLATGVGCWQAARTVTEREFRRVAREEARSEVAPVVDRVEALEARVTQVEALEARVAQLEVAAAPLLEARRAG